MSFAEVPDPKPQLPSESSAFELMDRMYRHQRYFYDLTRKFYLLGRDRLLARMPVTAGNKILEIGCGTGRNLIILAKKYPRARFFGLDASAVMLETAAQKMRARHLPNVTLRNALADDFHYRTTFDLNDQFDLVFFSYSISMIPTWKESVENALGNLRPGGTLFVVDFYDQKALPAWFQKLLQAWLRLFHVHYREELLPYLEKLERQNVGRLKVEAIARRYAFLAEFHKS